MNDRRWMRQAFTQKPLNMNITSGGAGITAQEPRPSATLEHSVARLPAVAAIFLYLPNIRRGQYPRSDNYWDIEQLYAAFATSAPTT